MQTFTPSNFATESDNITLRSGSTLDREFGLPQLTAVWRQLELEHYVAARDRGGRYLRKQMRSDGSFGNGSLADYYKVPCALQVCGQNSAASQLCQWIRRQGINADGDFGPRDDATSG